MLRKRLSAYLIPHRRFCGGVPFARREREAFLETMIAVGIIAVLAGVAIESQLPYLEKTAMAEAANLHRVQAAFVAEHYAVTGELPSDVITTDRQSAVAGRFFERVDWRDGEIVFVLDREIPGRLSELARGGTETVSWRVAATEDGGRLVFLCGRDEAPDGFSGPPSRHTTVPDSYLPLFCRS